MRSGEVLVVSCDANLGNSSRGLDKFFPQNTQGRRIGGLTLVVAGQRQRREKSRSLLASSGISGVPAAANCVLS